MEVTDAKPVLAYDDGAPAVLEKALGSGRIVHFTSYPGFSYFKIGYANTDGRFKGNAWGDLLVKPIFDGKVEQSVTVSVPLIEAPALYSKEGVAVTLLNWDGAPQKIDVTVAVDGTVRKVESCHSGKLAFKQDGQKVTVSMPLAEVDVLQLYY